MKKTLIAACLVSGTFASLAEVVVTASNAVSTVNPIYMANQAITGNGTSGTALTTISGHALLKCAGGVNSEAVLVFKLPTLPEGHSIINANLSVTGMRSFETLWNIDLYAFRSSASAPTVLMTDYGVFGDSADGIKLADNIFNPTDANAVYVTKSTDDAADLTLASWLSTQYASVGAGGYVFFRLQPDNAAAIGDSNAYNISGAGSVTYAIPQLTITVAPKNSLDLFVIE